MKTQIFKYSDESVITTEILATVIERKLRLRNPQLTDSDFDKIVLTFTYVFYEYENVNQVMQLLKKSNPIEIKEQRDVLCWLMEGECEQECIAYVFRNNLKGMNAEEFKEKYLQINEKAK